MHGTDTQKQALSHPRPHVSQTERYRHMAHTLTHLQAHACSHTHTLPRSMEKQGTCTHKHIQRNTELTRAQILQTYTEHTNPHALQSTCSWTHSRSSQTPCHMLDRHGCIEYTKTWNTKDTCTQTCLAHVHKGTHTHPRCVLTFCMRVPLPHCLLSSLCWPADWAQANAYLTEVHHLDWILRTDRWQCREAESRCHLPAQLPGCLGSQRGM